MASPQTTLMIGTAKGAFLATSKTRKTWDLSGPHCGGWPINHMASDPKTGKIWAAGGSEFFGAGVWRSLDQGQTWDLTRLTSGQLDGWAESEPEIAKSMGWTGASLPFNNEFTQIWSIKFTNGTLYAGTKPAQLLQSKDGGKTWSQNDTLANFPDRGGWQGGGAGLILHTIVPDPKNSQKLWIGISVAGVFATEDGGKTWDRRNRLSNADLCTGHNHPEAQAEGQIGHCVHNMVRANGENDLLYQQNHHGVWRSRDGGRSWDDIAEGLPSTFGFPIHVHPKDPDKIWTFPLNGDSIGRYPPEARAAVWRSSDGGTGWEATRTGLPQKNCFFTVLRQAMTGDAQDQPGIYFGTNSGSIYASLDEGNAWDEIVSHLPTILALEAI